MPNPALRVQVATEPGDLAGIEQVDLSYTTAHVYLVRRTGLGFRLDEQSIDPPATKTYPRPTLGPSGRLLVARVGTQIAGYGELRFEPWNGRARIEHLYVSGSFRGQGLGRLLIHALDERARQETSARRLWLETQNVNYPAVQFYLHMGFQLCGLDETLYDPDTPGMLPGEVALYFSRDLTHVPS
jgi:ribosomal protein S18 acetylase RimI-like enzyme